MTQLITSPRWLTTAIFSACVQVAFVSAATAQEEAPAPPAEEAPPVEESEDEDLEDLEDLDEMLDDVDEETSDEKSLRIDTIDVIQTPEEIAKTGSSAQMLDEEDLEAMEYDSPDEVMRQLPGVFVRTEDGFGLRPNIGIRGATADRSKKIALMEDGVLFGPAPYAAPAAYYFPLIGRMSAVEVYKGPTAIMFGPNTVGGALNLATRPVPFGNAGGADIALGSFPSGKAHVWHGWSNMRAGVLVEAMELASQGFKELDGGGPTGFDRTEMMLKAHVNSDPSKEVFHRFSVKGTYSRERSNETYLGLSDEDFRENPNRRYVASSEAIMQWQRFALRADYDLELGDALKFRATVYRHDFSRSWFKFNAFADGTSGADALANPDDPVLGLYYDVLSGQEDSEAGTGPLAIGTNQRTYYSQGLQVSARHDVESEKWSNRFKIGARLHGDQIERNHTEDFFDVVNGELVRTEDPREQTTLNRDEATAVSLWAIDQIDFWRLTLTPGFRLEQVFGTSTNHLDEDAEPAHNTQRVLLPAMGAFFDITKSLGALMGVHRGYSPVAPGQPASPELSVNYEAGLRQTFGTSGKVEVITFAADYQNLLGQCTFSAGCAEEDLDGQFNAGEARLFGVEAVGDYAFSVADGALSIPVRMAYTFTDTELLAEFDSSSPQFSDVQIGDELPYTPRHQGNVRLGVATRAGFSANLGATYVSPMRETTGQGEDPDEPLTDALMTVDALVAYSFAGWGNVYLKGDNLLNARPIASRSPYGARPIRPRFLQLGVRLDWGAKGEEE